MRDNVPFLQTSLRRLLGLGPFFPAAAFSNCCVSRDADRILGLFQVVGIFNGAYLGMTSLFYFFLSSALSAYDQ